MTSVDAYFQHCYWDATMWIASTWSFGDFIQQGKNVRKQKTSSSERESVTSFAFVGFVPAWTLEVPAVWPTPPPRKHREGKDWTAEIAQGICDGRAVTRSEGPLEHVETLALRQRSQRDQQARIWHGNNEKPYVYDLFALQSGMLRTFSKLAK